MNKPTAKLSLLPGNYEQTLSAILEDIFLAPPGQAMAKLDALDRRAELRPVIDQEKTKPD